MSETRRKFDPEFPVGVRSPARPRRRPLGASPGGGLSERARVRGPQPRPAHRVPHRALVKCLWTRFFENFRRRPFLTGLITRSCSLPLTKVPPARTTATSSWSIDAPPARLGGLEQLERHRRARVAAARSLGHALAQPDGGEGRLDRVGGASVFPVLGGEVVEHQQRVEVTGDLGDRLGVGREVGGEPAGGVDRGGVVLGVVDRAQRRPRVVVDPRRQSRQAVRDLVRPASLRPGGGPHVA